MPDSRLILIRHAEPEMDPDIDPIHWALSPEGRRQATALAHRLEPYGVEVVVTSQLPKAFETGRILAENLFIPVQTVAGLQEHSRDTVGWLSTGQFRDSVRSVMEQPDELVFGEETGTEAYTRFRAAIEGILGAHPGKTVAVVTHGTVLALYVAGLDGGNGSAFDLWRRLELPAFVVISRPELKVIEVVEGLAEE